MKRRSIKRAQAGVKQRSYMAARAAMKRRSQMAVLTLIAAASMSFTDPTDAIADEAGLVDDGSAVPVQTTEETAPIQKKPDAAPTPMAAPAKGAPSGGANDPSQTTFDPTGTGSAVPGAGGGSAVGMPDPGTVGNADAKDPPGQVGNTTDNGFECAPNPGIGNGNPAHTGCVPPAEQPPAEQPPAEQPPVEQPPAEQPPVVTPPVVVEQLSTETPMVEAPTEEVALVEIPAEEVAEEESSNPENSLAEATSGSGRLLFLARGFRLSNLGGETFPIGGLRLTSASDEASSDDQPGSSTVESEQAVDSVTPAALPDTGGLSLLPSFAAMLLAGVGILGLLARRLRNL